VGRTEYERRAARLPERVLQLVRAIGGGDVDQDRADLGRCGLREDPFGMGWRPDADAVAFDQAPRHQSAREGIARLPKLPVGVAQSLMAGDQRLLLRNLLHDLIEEFADRSAEERNVAGPMNIGKAVCAEVERS